jgi:hypothetical protein
LPPGVVLLPPDVVLLPPDVVILPPGVVLLPPGVNTIAVNKFITYQMSEYICTFSK